MITNGKRIAALGRAETAEVACFHSAQVAGAPAPDGRATACPGEWFRVETFGTGARAGV